MLAMPDVAAKMIEATDADRLARVRADAEIHPSRVFANALVNVAWRNGPVEDIHGGQVPRLPTRSPPHRRPPRSAPCSASRPTG